MEASPAGVAFWFQSTHPRGVRLSVVLWRGIIRRCFNPRTRVGCDRFSFSVSSIPERFQSTHPRGVRLTLSETLGVELGGFNPRTRVGCDNWPACPHSRSTRFQSTHPRGVRRPWTGSMTSSTRFQSTHPRGVRRGGCCSRVAAISGFNPRTRVGCDDATEVLWGLFQSFNPRTRVGCDTRNLITLATANRFNPRTRVGCDTPFSSSGAWMSVSIHAPAWGATPAPA